jgi:hypothetical protein
MPGKSKPALVYLNDYAHYPAASFTDRVYSWVSSQIGNSYDCRKFQAGMDTLFGPRRYVFDKYPTPYTPRLALRRYVRTRFPCTELH